MNMTEEDFNIIALLRITEEFCSSNMDEFDHVIEMLGPIFRRLQVILNKVDDSGSDARQMRLDLHEAMDIALSVRDSAVADDLRRAEAMS
jgi:hypothetical protein